MASSVSVPHTFLPGTPALSAEVNQNFLAVSNAINDNHVRLSAVEASLAAPRPSFRASLSGAQVNVTQGDLVLDVEHHDEGNVYDPAMGAFTAPRTGLYHLAFVSHYNEDDGVMQMLKNGSEVLAAAWADGGTTEDEDIPVSITVTVPLQAGDSVSIYVRSSSIDIWGTNHNGPFTYWSGYLIQDL